MTVTSPTPPVPSAHAPGPAKIRRRKARAVLAGGTVLGLGAAVTLASWNDSEFVEGLFGTGEFAIESNVYGSDDALRGWQGTAASAEQAVELQFEAGNIQPGQAYTSEVFLRVSQNTGYDAVIQGISGGVPAGTAPVDVAAAFEVEVYPLYPDLGDDARTAGPGGAHFNCTAAAGSGNTPVASGDLSQLAGSPGIPLAQWENDANAEHGIQLCFVVTAPGEEDLPPGFEATAVWQIEVGLSD
jgi:predicted ribosomally synthesized peptide with SipW-like signal peptide